MLIWLVRWYNIQSPILHDHTEVGGHARANSEGGGVELGCNVYNDILWAEVKVVKLGGR